jgi:hypothetical protein
MNCTGNCHQGRKTCETPNACGQGSAYGHECDAPLPWYDKLLLAAMMAWLVLLGFSLGD